MQGEVRGARAAEGDGLQVLLRHRGRKGQDYAEQADDCQLRCAGKDGRQSPRRIGVTDHGVEGCEIVVPSFSWSETWQLPLATYNWAYSQVLKAVTGRVNSASFRGFPAGQVAFSWRQGLGVQQGPDADSRSPTPSSRAMTSPG